MNVYRNGSAADRAKRSQAISQLLQMQRRKDVATRTYAQLRNFEEHARTFQKKREDDVDDMPLNATASNMRSLTTTLPDDLGDSSDESPRTPHALKMYRSQSDSFMVRETEELYDADDVLHARRPPSPLSFYDYGNINLKPRSAFSQQRVPAPEDGQSKHRLGSTCGHYFPGPDYKQGPYGFSMLDPILMPPRCWEPRRGPQRTNQCASDVRPRHAKSAANDAAIKQSHISKPTAPEMVRSTRGHDMKTQHVARTLDRNHDEAHLEKECHEDGSFGGRWCHPRRSKAGTHLQHGPVEHHDWMQQDLSGLGDSEMLASRILAGITRALQEQHSTVPRLFWSVNRGAQGVLEIEEFMEGLVRLQVVDYDEIDSLKVLSEAMTFIDPDFDGRVNYPALNRAVTAAQNAQRKQRRASSAGRFQGSLATSTNYSNELQVEVVKMDKNSKSVCDFNRSKDTFRRQQTALLAQHGERVDAV